LGTPPPGDPALDPNFHGVTEDDLRGLPANLIGGPVTVPAANAFDAIQALRQIYSSTIGYDYDHVHIPAERTWLREAAESGRFRPPQDPIDPRRLLERLTQVEVFEHFLHRIFPGKTRFSIEGVDMLVPLLDEIVGGAAEAGICAIVIGMAHRGRLNVLAHVLGMTYEQILAEFKAPKGHFTAWDTLGWTGDVKYHKGARRAVDSNEEIKIVIALPANPSHLEHINPVIEGMARAADSKVDQAGAPSLFNKAALPILIHGDAAFTGEGVVAETLNLSRLPGYATGGTLHIIANNQLGYTATEVESRSSLYASDLAKGYQLCPSFTSTPTTSKPASKRSARHWLIAWNSRRTS
jgi:2-oxoglutarate dehydrogenase E1 component